MGHLGERCKDERPNPPGARERADEPWTRARGPAARVLELQRFAGNAAVSRWMQRERAFSVVVDQAPGSYAGTFGSADADVAQWRYPQVELTPAEGGVRFAPAVAEQTTEGRAFVTPEGEPSAGYFMRQGDRLLGDTVMEGFKWRGEPAPPGRPIEVRYVVDAAFRKELITAEKEHLDDFALAYRLSVERLANAINGLAGRVFPSAAAATEALAATLSDAPQLVPKDPTNLGSWSTRARQVALALTSMSIRRDDSDHVPLREFEYDGKAILVRLKMKDVHRAPSELVKLADVPAVYEAGGSQQAAPAAAAFPLGPAVLTSRAGAEFFTNPELTGDAVNELLLAGTSVTVVAAGGGDVIAALARLHFTEQLAAWMEDAAQLFFKVSPDALRPGAATLHEEPSPTPEAPSSPVHAGGEEAGEGAGIPDFDLAAEMALANWAAPGQTPLGPPPGAPPPPPPDG